MHKALHLRDDIDKQYVSRKGGSGFDNIEDSVDASTGQLKDYIKKCKERPITATKISTGNIKINRITITQKKKWEEKQQYRYFMRQTNEISYKKTWTWLRRGNLKIETESLLKAAQNNAIRTNYINAFVP